MLIADDYILGADYYKDFNNPRHDLEEKIDEDLMNIRYAYTEHDKVLGRGETYWQKVCINEQINYLTFVRDKINRELQRAKKASAKANGGPATVYLISGYTQRFGKPIETFNERFPVGELKGETDEC